MNKYGVTRTLVCSSCGYTETPEHYDGDVIRYFLEMGWKIDDAHNYYLCPTCNR